MTRGKKGAARQKGVTWSKVDFVDAKTIGDDASAGAPRIPGANAPTIPRDRGPAANGTVILFRGTGPPCVTPARP